MRSPSWLHSMLCDTRRGHGSLFLLSLIFTPAALCIIIMIIIIIVIELLEHFCQLRLYNHRFTDLPVVVRRTRRAFRRWKVMHRTSRV